jgi:putative transposase
MAGVRELTPAIGNTAACRSLGVWRGQPAREQARQHHLAFVGPRRARSLRPRPPLALASCENKTLLDTLNSERFCDSAPASVYATLLGHYLCSVRTSYRLLSTQGGSPERRSRAHEVRLSGPPYRSLDVYDR